MTVIRSCLKHTWITWKRPNPWLERRNWSNSNMEAPMEWELQGQELLAWLWINSLPDHLDLYLLDTASWKTTMHSKPVFWLILPLKPLQEWTDQTPLCEMNLALVPTKTHRQNQVFIFMPGSALSNSKYFVYSKRIQSQRKAGFFLAFCLAAKTCRVKMIGCKNDILREIIKKCSSKVINK